MKQRIVSIFASMTTRQRITLVFYICSMFGCQRTWGIPTVLTGPRLAGYGHYGPNEKGQCAPPNLASPGFNPEMVENDEDRCELDIRRMFSVARLIVITAIRRFAARWWR